MGTDDLPLPANEDAALPLAAATPEERNWGMACHLSSYLGFLAGGLSFLGPLVCWLIKKDSSRFVDYHGKESLNFQLNIFLYLLISTLISIGFAFVTCGVGVVLFVLPAAVAVYGLIMPVIAGIRASSGELYRYPLTFRLIK